VVYRSVREEQKRGWGKGKKECDKGNLKRGGIPECPEKKKKL